MMAFNISRSCWAAAIVTLIVGLAMILALALGRGVAVGFQGFCIALGALAMTAASSGALGGLTGFVFAIPRTGESIHRSAQANGDNSENGHVAPNSNLQQVSDWLTKIMLGAGLTQINQIGTQLVTIGDKIGQATGVPAAIVPPLIIYFIIFGFIGLYVWTSIHFTGLINDVSQRLNTVQNELLDVRKAGDHFGHWRRAWDVMEVQLGKERRQDDTPVEDIEAALKPLTSEDRAKVFYYARRVRADNWQRNSKRMARTIPIFQALINLDLDQKYHRNYAQIGYCLKDKSRPDYHSAIKFLDEAIRIRDGHGIDGWTVYEFNRALCWIELDLKDPAKQHPEQKKAIIADLIKSMEFEDLPAMLDHPGISAAAALRSNEKILKWCQGQADKIALGPLSEILEGDGPLAAAPKSRSNAKPKLV